MHVRRVVAGVDEHGRSIVQSDGDAPHTHDFQAVDGLSQTRIWFSEGPPTGTLPGSETTTAKGTVMPAAGGVSFIIQTLPAASASSVPGFDRSGAGAEFAEWSPDLAKYSDNTTPGMHHTPTIDLGVMLSGEAVMEMGDGSRTTLRAGDTFVQVAGSHAWRNETEQQAVMAIFVAGVEAP